jgi:hypothetical protein
MGIEPTTSAWKAEVLPLNYTRIYAIFYNTTRNDHAYSSTSFFKEARYVEATRRDFPTHYCPFLFSLIQRCYMRRDNT